MIQDIAPSKMDNSFKNYQIREEDNLIIFDKEGKTFVQEKNDKVAFASGASIKEEEAIYLFSVDDKRYFLLNAEGIDYDKYLAEGFTSYTIREVRDRFSGVDDVNVFVTFTAYHLWKWYSDNRFCGKCGKPLSRGDKERSLICPECGNVIYPRINPAVIVGVTKGFEKQLEIVGVGYRFQQKGNVLVINAGYSHPVEMQVPQGITVEYPSNTELTIKGINKELVGEFAANVRKVRQPEPYKGKGIRYKDEHIIRKEGKKAA